MKKKQLRWKKVTCFEKKRAMWLKKHGSQLDNGRVEIESRALCTKTREALFPFFVHVRNKESKGIKLVMWSNQVIWNSNKARVELTTGVWYWQRACGIDNGLVELTTGVWNWQWAALSSSKGFKYHFYPSLWYELMRRGLQYQVSWWYLRLFGDGRGEGWSSSPVMGISWQKSYMLEGNQLDIRRKLYAVSMDLLSPRPQVLHVVD